MAHDDDTNMPMIALVGVTGVILTVASIVGLQALYYNYELRLFERKVVSEPYLEADSRLAQQESKLNSPYGWIDQEKGVLAIPIERAKQLVVRELREEQKRQENGRDPSSKR